MKQYPELKSLTNGQAIDSFIQVPDYITYNQWVTYLNILNYKQCINYGRNILLRIM